MNQRLRDPSELHAKDLTRLMVRKALDDSEPLPEGVLRFVASTSDMDREGDTIDQDGWDLTAIRANPVFLWAHDYSHPPIGKIEDIQVIDGELCIEVMFDLANEFAAYIYRLYVDGFMSAVSVGFNPTRWVYREDGIWGIDFVEQEALEVSAVPVPANGAALIMRANKSLHAKGALGQVIEWLKAQGFGVSAPVDPALEGLTAEQVEAVEAIAKGARVSLEQAREWAEPLLHKQVPATKAIAPGELEVGEYASWSTGGGEARGKALEIITSDVIEVPGTELTIEASAEDPVALLAIYEFEDEQWVETDMGTAVKFSDLTKIDPLAPVERATTQEDTMKIHLDQGGVIEPSKKTKAMILHMLTLEAKAMDVDEDIEDAPEAPVVTEEALEVSTEEKALEEEEPLEDEDLNDEDMAALEALEAALFEGLALTTEEAAIPAA